MQIQNLTFKQKVEEIKNKVTIPMYFYSIIVPQMGDYYDLYPVDFDQKIVVCCPLHDEDTPSCRYYESTNSFYCFGCQRGGDVVKLHQYFVEQRITGEQPKYSEAVEFIYKTFIEGRETQQIVQTQLYNDKLNTDEDIVRLNVYRKRLEDSITVDHNITLDAKVQLWDLLDTVDILLSKNKIKVDDAIQYIKQQVKQIITAETTVKQHTQLSYKGN